MKATEDFLSQLHGRVAQTLMEQLCDEEVKPAMVAQAVKFLKDNDITVSISEDENMTALDEMLKQHREKRKLRIVGDE